MKGALIQRKERDERMNDLRPPRRIGRSIAALLIGMAAGIALTIATDLVLHALHVFPSWDQRVPDGLLALATAYRTVYSIAGSYVIARLAPYKPMQHALVAGAIGTIVSLAGAVATWNGGPAYEPHWYPIALVVLALPCAWIGAKLCEKQLQAGPK
jgi:peptidoglycan/LPS O-acetylase OafA/YrhL